MTEATYDLIVIGSGQGGGPLAGAFAKAGRRALLIERDQLGGTCVNVGCTPTKTMIGSARAAYVVREHAAAMGVVIDGTARVDMRQVRDRMTAMVEKFRNGTERSLEHAGVEVARGVGRFVGPLASRNVAIRDAAGRERIARADIVVIDTGARPSPPSIDGLDDVGALDTTSVMQLDAVPAHLLIVGGGDSGLEFAQMFRRFGSEVTVLQRHAQLMPREDDDVIAAVTEILREDGIRVLTAVSATHVARGPNGTIRLSYRDTKDEAGVGADRVVEGSHLLVATGRRANTDALDLAAAGVATDDRGFVIVGERLETNVQGIFAIGDVTGEAAFTHVSYDDYRIVRDNLLHGATKTTRGRIIPYTVFIDPQLGRVGMTEREARASGRSVRVATLPMSRVARALEIDETRGFMKAVVDAQSGMILGVSILGVDGGEVATVVQVAMMAGMPHTALRDAMFAHPTVSESLNNLFMALDA